MHKYSIKKPKKSVPLKFDAGDFRHIIINEEWRAVLDALENSPKNIFITGRAGTGKSTLLDYWRAHTRQNLVVLAPTGVAALNVRGQTVHSFFGFKPGVSLSDVRKMGKKDNAETMYGQLDAIVIDEVSMVRADLLDCVDKFMRLNGRDRGKPFGGARLIVFGDLHQLPPVVTDMERAAFYSIYRTPYFFSAKVFIDRRLLGGFEFDKFELTEIHRQKDQNFIRLLNRIRDNEATADDLDELNRRHDPNFVLDDDYYIYLTATNYLAAEINNSRLNRLNGKAETFSADQSGRFDDRVQPTDEKLKLKIGAQVMLINNDPSGRWVNGTIGVIKKFSRDNYNLPIVQVELPEGEIVEVGPYTWKAYRYFLNRAAQTVEAEEVGAFTQLPIKLAWAVTIHKAQGKTFDRVVLDVGRGMFASGQLYVALSRCTSLDGIVLVQPIAPRHIISDPLVTEFLRG